MKKLSILIVFIGLALSSRAQQVPLYSNYFFTPYIYNPAFSGTDGVTEAALLHRRQWSGVQGSPETSAFGVNGSLNDEKVGWSLYGFSDKTDILNRLGIYGNYAYHVRLSDNTRLSFGIGAGYINQVIDQAAVRAQDQGDIFTVVAPNRGTFDLNAGIALHIEDFELGASAPQLLSQNINYTDNADGINYNLIRHYVFNAQYNFKFGGDKQVLSPMVMVRTAENNVPVQVDAGLLFNLVEYGYIGAMYRSDYAVTGNIGVNLTDQLTLGYAYDFSIDQYATNLGTSHEFMLTYRFGSNKENERLENELKRLKQQQRRQRDETEEMIDEKLEEFKDSYKDEIEQTLEEERQKLREAAQQTGGAGTGRAVQGGQGRGQQQAGGQSDDIPVSDPGAGQTQFDPSAQASSVQPGSPGYYIVAGVFSSESNAQRKQNELRSKNFQARYFRDPQNNFYYVFLMKFDNYQQADQAKSSKLNGRYVGDLWVKIVE